jgi:hypothetical protein
LDFVGLRISKLRLLLSTLALPLAPAGCTTSSPDDDPAADDIPTAGSTGEAGGAGTGVAGTGTATGEPGSTGSTGPDSAGTDGPAESSGSTSGDNAECGQVIFLNFDGVTLVPGGDDATDNRSPLVVEETVLAPYAGDDRGEILAVVEDQWAPFDVCIVDERPGEGPYTMAVVTPTNILGETIWGTAVLDCNGWGSNITLTFPGMWATSPTAIANIVSADLAPTFGVERTVGGEGITCGALCNGLDDVREFADACEVMRGAGPNMSCPTLDQSCLDGTVNPYQRLLSRLGPA